MENIPGIFENENIPNWLKYLIIGIIVLSAIATIIAIIAGAYNKYKTAKKDSGATHTNNNPSTDKVQDEHENHLESKYTSLFAEDNRLKSEQIHITKQHNGSIEGTVSLIETDLNNNTTSRFTYYLIGKYNNRILTAEYYSQDSVLDERGAINLKLIDRSILSGFCSFSKLSASDDEIRVSPYVWVAGENQNLVNGTFDFCTECFKERKVCCCASPKVDTPVFINNELPLIRSQLAPDNKEKNSFSKLLNTTFTNGCIRQMNQVDKKDREGNILLTKCHFYDADNYKCIIYDGRPIDCRLFPYDIRLKKDSGEYIIGYYTELCERNLPDASTMKKRAHILRPYFFLLYPYLHIVTSDEACKRLKDADFHEIGSFKEFVF